MRNCKLNETLQFLIYADDVYWLGGGGDAINKSTKSLLGASKETGVEVNADTQLALSVSLTQRHAMGSSINGHVEWIWRAGIIVLSSIWLGKTANSISQETGIPSVTDIPARSPPTYLVSQIQNKTTKLFCLQDEKCLAISRDDYY